MRTIRATLSLLFVLTLLPTATRAQNQEKAAGTLGVTSTSAEARTAFWAGADDLENAFPSRAATHLQRALQLDPKLGLARAYYGARAPGLSADQRKEELERAVTDAVGASTEELLVALAMRAQQAGRAEEEKTLLKAAAALAPNEPRVAFYSATTIVERGARSKALEEVTRKFPDYAPAFNLLAYARFRDDGDRAGGLAAAERYMQLLPDHPNSHDTYAELLAWSGRLDEAGKHYQRALELAPELAEGHAGLAEVAMLKGDAGAARTHYAHAIERASTPQAKLGFRAAIGTTSLSEGNVKAAMNEYAQVAAEAENNNFPGIAATTHINMAIVEAAGGNAKGAHDHLAASMKFGNPEAPGRQGSAALVHALLGHLDAAKPFAEKALASTTEPGTSAANMRSAHALQGIMAAAAGDVQGARQHAEMAKPAGAMAKVLAAEALKKSGKKAEAQALKAEVLSANEYDFGTIVAKNRAKKL